MLPMMIRGGKLTFHNVNMFRQVMTVTVILTVLAGAIFWSCKTWFSYDPYERYALASYYWADMKLSLPGPKEKVTQNYRYAKGQEYVVRSLDLKQNEALQIWAKDFERRMQHNAWLSLWFMIGFFFLICTSWIWRGKIKKEKEIKSGNRIVEPKELKKLIKGELSPIHIRGINLRKNSETQHFIISGTTGAGKTTSLSELLPQIRELKQRAVVVDTTGEFVASYYREGRDILINPFDDRTVGWSPFMDCVTHYHYDELAAALISQISNESFWTENARIIFAETLKHCERIKKMDMQYVLDILLKYSLKDLYEFLKPTNAATLVDPAGDKTAQSIRTHLVSALRPLEYLVMDRESFSIRQWVQNEKDDSWLFLTSTQDQLETLRPLLSALTGIAIKSLLACPKDIDRRLWYIFDEFSSLQKFSALTDALKGIRKFGGCVVMGLQGLPQLEKIYGHAEAKEIIGLLNTRLVFANNDPDTARRLSDMMGEQEVQEAVEGISYGASDFRDGVSINDQNKIKPVISASDIMTLNNLEAFLKLPGNLPVTKVVYKNTYLPLKNQEFIPIKNYDSSMLIEKKQER